MTREHSLHVKRYLAARDDIGGAPIANPPRLKLQTFALAPGQTLIPKCSFCFKVLRADEGPSVTTLRPCIDPKCQRARQVIDAA